MESANYNALIKEALLRLETLEAELEAERGANQQARHLVDQQHEPIAIIGMGCRLPGGIYSPADYWQLLREGRETASEIPANRWDLESLYDPDPSVPGKMYTRFGSFIDEPELFDAQFFNISPREAISMDPQQRLLLEVTWEALESANLVPDQLYGSQTGVFVGISNTEYINSALSLFKGDIFTRIDPYFGTGNAFSTASGRLSYSLRLVGPNVAVDTACSSSLSAIYLACQSLRCGQSSLALAGGVNMIFTPGIHIAFSKARMLSPDGHCKTFDAAADGYLRGEGCGMIVLKRLADAQRDGDQVLAVIRGVAMNQDGASSGLTVPSGPSQQAVVRQALADARVRPEEVSYVEAHGTGTFLGDPIEAGALAEVFGAHHDEANPLFIGSVKTNIGHLESAAGISGLLKIVLAMQHGEIPRNLHFKQLNPNIPWNGLALRVPTQHTTWQASRYTPGRRIAGISGFGFGGTNVHLVLEEAPRKADAPTGIPAEQPAGQAQVLCLSARSEDALRAMAARYAGFLAQADEGEWPAICYSSHHHRSQFRYRLAVVATDLQEAAAALRDYVCGQKPANIFSGQAAETARPRLAFLFTGQGAQYAGMGRELYACEPVFREWLERCSALLGPLEGHTLLEVIFAGPGLEDLINETRYTQPALFALQYALARLLESWGIRAGVMMGHSIGEYAAACLAGVFSLEDGLRLVAARGRLMSSLPHNGKMLAVFSAVETVRAHLKALFPAMPLSGLPLAVAAVNSPENVVVSGEAASVDELAARLKQHGIRCEALQVSHAFHSPLMEPILAAFETVARTIPYHPPQIPLVANLHGSLAEDGELESAEYWTEHIRQAVQFMAGMQSLQQMNVNYIVEIGPRPALTGLGRQCLGKYAQVTFAPTLRQGRPATNQMAACLAQLYSAGYPVPWQHFDRRNQQAVHAVQLPTYPFQRQRYWLADPDPLHPEAGEAPKAKKHPLLGKKLDLAGIAGQVFETSLTPTSPSYLGEHRLFHQNVMPGMAFLEMVIAAGRECFPPEQSLAILDARIEQPLIFTGSQPCPVQTILTPRADGSADVAIYFRPPNPDGSQTSTWQRLISAVLQHGSFPPPPGLPSPSAPALGSDAYQATGWSGPAPFYQQLSMQGYEYGPAFQTVHELHLLHESQARGYDVWVRLPQSRQAQAAGHILHPGLLDGLLQPIGQFFNQPGRLQLPVRFRHFTYHVPPAAITSTELSACVRRRSTLPAPDGTAIGEPDGPPPADEIELTIYDALTGSLLASAVGELTSVDRMVFFRLLEPAFNNWFYHLDWVALAGNPEPVKPAAARGAWLLCADSLGCAAGLAQRLLADGSQVTLVTPGAALQTGPLEAGGIRQISLDPLAPEHWHALFKGLGPLKGIVHCANLDIASDVDPLTLNLPTLQAQSAAGLLHMLQAASHAYGVRAPRLWIVTRGAWHAAGSQQQHAPFQALAWGLARSLNNELSEFKGVVIDLDPDDTDLSCMAEFLKTQLYDPTSSDDMLALRAGQLYGLRIKPGWQPGTAVLPGRAYHLAIGEYGLLENLHLEPLQRTSPQADEVEIEVRAAGLNLRDVLNALGMLRQFAAELGIDSAQELPFGGECSGVISAVGQNAAGRFKVGDEVIAGMAIGSMASHVHARADAVALKPPHLSFAEAATLPTTSLTAAYGLNSLAGIRPGERVLIHAAAGGVGQAAVQIAQRAGAVIYATASPAKWDFLRAQGIEHIYNSRTLEFQEQILADTGGQGVEIVLNSLAGEFVLASLAVLGAGGRFVEIGKLGILTQVEFQQRRPDAQYFPFDLLDIAIHQPEVIAASFAALQSLWAEGQICPLPFRTFPLHRAAEAFQFMAQARHIGKVVLVQPQPPVAIRPDRTYLITGGLGGLGLQTASWLIHQGARHLLLAGRSGAASAEAQAALATLRGMGAQVTPAACDMGSRTAVSALVESLQAGAWPLAGVIHAAGVNEIAALRDYQWPDFARHLQPKVAGTWNLHLATLHLPLDFFICFSSMSALLPTAGQASYSASNLFMDALMQARRAAGLPGTSINWGPWAEVGMVSRLEAHLQQGQLAAGLLPFSNAGGRMAFEVAMAQITAPAAGDSAPVDPQGLGQVYVMAMDWQRFAAFAPALAGTPALSEVIKVQAGNQRRRGELLEQIKALPVDERKPFLFQRIQQELSSILSLSVTQIERHQRLLDFGMDSLMAIEFKNSLEISLACSLPATMVFDYPTVGEVTDFLVDEMLGLGDATPQEKATRSTSSVLAPLQTGGTGRALFFVHPISGQIMCYRDLAQHLGPVQPFYALQAHGVDGSEEPLASIELMAARYISEIQTIQPNGPYRLGGWSMGGIIAYEMARLLHERGEQTEMLALIDCHMPGARELDLLRQAQPLSPAGEVDWMIDFAADLSGYYGVGLAIARDHLLPWPRTERLQHVWQAVHDSSAALSGITPDNLAVQWNVYRSHRQALGEYLLALAVREPYPGPANLYFAESAYRGSGGGSILEQEIQAWQQRVSGALHETVLSGDHYSILRDDGLLQLADQMQGQLRRMD